jgi:hypothetical protein
MALLWADGYGHWGSDANFGTAYLVSDSVSLTGANPRTGNTALLCSNNRTFHAKVHNPSTRIISGRAVLQSTPFPGGTAAVWILDAGGGVIGIVSYNASNGLDIFKNNFQFLASTAPNLLPVGAYNYIEVDCFSDNGAGLIEVKINNTTVELLTGLALSGAPIGRIGWGGNYLNVRETPIPSQLADFYICDASGAYNNTFLGDVRCRTFFPASNGPLQDWAHTGGNAWDAINNVPYDPAQFISTPNIGDKSNFGKAALPTNTAYLAGVNVFAVAQKSDSGACEITPQISSNGVVGNMTPIVPAVGDAFYNSIMETDPNTGTLFTRLGFDAALPQVERTA